MHKWSDFEKLNDKQLYHRPETYQPEPSSGGGLLDNVRQLWHWDDLAAEISQESQARVAFVGLTGSGKSTLYNHLRGWPVAKATNTFNGSTASGAVFVESYGTFVLADLPRQERLSMVAGEEIILALGVDVEIEKVTDAKSIAMAGVISTPGVAVDGKLVHAGGLPDAAKLEKWLTA